MRRELIVDPLLGVSFSCEVGSHLFTPPEDFPFSGFRIFPKFVTLILRHFNPLAVLRSRYETSRSGGFPERTENVRGRYDSNQSFFIDHGKRFKLKLFHQARGLLSEKSPR